MQFIPLLMELPMNSCPHCQYDLPDPIPASCPVCFGTTGTLYANPRPADSPVAAVPAILPPGYSLAAPSFAQPAQKPMRMTLTGEVVATEAPPSFPATTPIHSTLPPPLPTRAVAAAPAQRRSSPRENAPYSARNSALLINFTVVVVLLAAVSGGIWWKWMHRTNPKSQVERYLHAIQWLDWGVVWDLSATPPDNQSRHQFIEKLDEPFEGNGVLRLAARKGYESYTFDVGEPSYTGAEATVPATVGSRSVQFKAQNFGGVWKIVPKSVNPLDILQGFNEEEEKKNLESDLKSALDKMKN